MLEMGQCYVTDTQRDVCSKGDEKKNQFGAHRHKLLVA